MTIKKSFILYTDTLDVLDVLTDEQAGKLLRAIRSYHDNSDLIIPQDIQIAFSPFKNQFDRDHAKYLNVCDKNRINGMKGGRPRTHNNPVGCLETQRNPNNLDTDTDTDTDTEKINNKLSPKVISVPFQKIVDLYHEKLPTLPRVEKLTKTRKSYIRQRWLQQDLPDMNHWENFFDYVSKSKFLMGNSSPVNGHRVFRANLEWLTKESNFTKISEENYHG